MPHQSMVSAVQAPGCNVPLIHLLISALYTLFACLLGFPHLLPFCLLIFPYLSTSSPFPLRVVLLHFQAGGRKRRQNLGLSCLTLF